MNAPQNLQTLKLTNGMVADVVSGQWLTDVDVIIAGDDIVALAPVGTVQTHQTVDLAGQYLVPAFIDSHMHIESSVLTPEHLCALLACQGTGCIIADPHEIANVAGKTGLDYMIDATKNCLINVRIMLPSCVPATTFEHSGATLTAKDLAPYFDRENVLGLAEVMNVPGVLYQDPEVMDKLHLAKERGCPIDGHAPQVSGEALKAYAAAGVMSDHECSTIEEVRERTALGMGVNLRLGSAGRNLEKLICAVTDETADKCMFCCDDVLPAEVAENGHMQRHLRLAVAAGLTPMRALQMATINAARHYGLNDMGAISVGRKANFAVLSDLTHFTVTQTWINGRKVSENGKLLVEVKTSPIPEAVLSSVNFAAITKENLEIPLSGTKARVIEIVPFDLATRSRVKDVALKDGKFNAPMNPGLATLAVVERHHATGNIGLGIVSGYLKAGSQMNGAVATTIAHDSHNIVMLGDTPESMLAAAEELKRIGGGMVLVKDGQVVESLPLEVAGLMSSESAESFIPKQAAFHKKARELFEIADGIDPLMTLSFLALPVIPELRVTDLGLFDVTKFELTQVSVQ